MSFTKAFISVFFLFLSASLFAEKPANILVCHVGSDTGSADQTYMENPNCDEPVDWDSEVEFRCPDAGKIDLILVPANAKHTGNPAHAYEGIPDYVPFKEEAGGNPLDFEDGNGDGIDDGCEPDDYQLTCLCWDIYKLSEFVTLLNGWYATGAQGSGVCGERTEGEWTLYGMRWLGPETRVDVRERAPYKSCAIERSGPPPNPWFFTRGVTDAQYSACVDELNAVMAVAEVCKVP